MFVETMNLQWNSIHIILSEYKTFSPSVLLQAHTQPLFVIFNIFHFPIPFLCIMWSRMVGMFDGCRDVTLSKFGFLTNFSASFLTKISCPTTGFEAELLYTILDHLTSTKSTL